MNITLFPRPEKLEMTSGTLAAPSPLTVDLPENLNVLKPLLEETLETSVTISADAFLHFAANPSLDKEAYLLHITSDGISIEYAAPNGAYYALVTLGQILTQCNNTLPCCDITDAPALSVRGYMLDISRGKVPALADLCGIVDRLAKLKYNQLQLYVEGFSFAYPSFPEVWKDQTPITGEEIRYLDAYCKARFIELVPNQNSLGHMSAWLSKEEFHHLSETEQGSGFMGMPTPPSTLDAMNPDSLKLVTALMDDMIPFFSSDKFNVNMDEPFELGKEKNKALAEEKGSEYLYLDYMNRLHDEVTARGKKMYMWGDILAHHTEVFDTFPKDITVLDWGYEAITPFEEHATLLEEKGISFLLCPGTSVWTTLSGRTDNMFANIEHAATAAIKHHGAGVMVTAWGDNGHIEYEPLNDGPMAYAAACCWGRTDTTEEETSHYVNQYIYHDKAGKAAQFVFDLGRYYHYEELPMVNMTIANVNLMMGILPPSAFPYALEQMVHGVLAFVSGPDADYLNGLLANKKEFDYKGACEHMDNLKQRFTELQFTGSNASLLSAELENTLCLVEFAEKVHYLNATCMTLPAEEKATLTASIKELGNRFLEHHDSLWIARNKIHGKDMSVGDIKRILQQLEA